MDTTRHKKYPLQIAISTLFIVITVFFGLIRLLVKEHKGVCCYRFDETMLNELAAVVSSYPGHFKLANSYHLWQVSESMLH